MSITSAPEMGLPGLQSLEPPESQTLVGVYAAGVVASLVDECKRCRKTERLRLPGERGAIARFDVRVLAPANEGGCQEVLGSRSAQVLDGGENVALREMTERVWTKHEIGRRQPVATNIAAEELAPRGGPPLAIGSDERGHNVNTDI